ncbi:hypothetical protein CDAR_425581 [Caerostris darwini]|uniref:Uncharacterized protein n=1 Tax=Caerostris darwini TaxID=1538125 RepID=A0AAV4NGF1_9ARAC|nr:hypothetical protein CDAR_425581 [Caerostris darwini]
MDPAPVLTEADVCRKITAATQLLTERRKLHDLATQAITKQQILMDAGLVTAKTIKASAATIKKAAEAVLDAENQNEQLCYNAAVQDCVTVTLTNTWYEGHLIPSPLITPFDPNYAGLIKAIPVERPKSCVLKRFGKKTTNSSVIYDKMYIMYSKTLKKCLPPKTLEDNL